jgi:hypothetical protein
MIIIAKMIKSNSAGVILCLIGATIQGFHTFHIIYEGSSLNTNIPLFEDYTLNMKLLQSWLAALFFSIGLLYFTFKAGSVKDYLKDKYIRIAKGFALFEAFINVHYWTRNKIYIPYRERVNESLQWFETAEWYDWSILLVFAIALPVIISKYAGVIKIKDNYDDSPPFLEGLEKDGLDFKIVRNYKNGNNHYLKLKKKE